MTKTADWLLFVIMMLWAFACIGAVRSFDHAEQIKALQLRVTELEKKAPPPPKGELPGLSDVTQEDVEEVLALMDRAKKGN